MIHTRVKTTSEEDIILIPRYCGFINLVIIRDRHSDKRLTDKKHEKLVVKNKTILLNDSETRDLISKLAATL